MFLLNCPDATGQDEACSCAWVQQGALKSAFALARLASDRSGRCKLPSAHPPTHPPGGARQPQRPLERMFDQMSGASRLFQNCSGVHLVPGPTEQGIVQHARQCPFTWRSSAASVVVHAIHTEETPDGCGPSCSSCIYHPASEM